MNPQLWRGVAATIEAIVTSGVPSDVALRQLFKQQRRLGRRDRTEVGDAVYGTLRRLRSLDFRLGPDWRGQSRPRLAAWLWRYGGYTAAAAAEAAIPADPGQRAALAAYLAACPATSNEQLPAPPAVRHDLSDWLHQDLADQLPDTELGQLARALKQAAPLDLRVNTLACRRDDAIRALAAEGHEFAVGELSPVALRSPLPQAIQRSNTLSKGWVEVQDEGSQLVAPLLEPRRGDSVVDLCAGAGGKTLHLAALMAGRGHIHAFDLSERRLQQLRARCRRAGVSLVRAVRIADERATAVRRLSGKVDRVLVDAPCSGTGTLRRRPELCWQQHQLDALTGAQDRLLDAAAALLRPGGRLVYATCSLLRSENEQRAAAFEGRHRGTFTAVDLGPVLQRRKLAVGAAPEVGRLRLYPHRHGCDGFFAAVWERTG